MSNTFSQRSAPRVIFFGMLGSFSLPSLASLLASGIDVCAVVLPSSRRQEGRPAIFRREVYHPARSLLPVVHSTLHANIVQLADECQIPVWEVQRLDDPATLATLSAYEPDAICVACFSQRIPRSLLSLPCLGCLNVHPSLLPANRGPVPLFWTFRTGEEYAGVTIHLMDEGMDSGPILAQECIAVDDGVSYAELEAQCAGRGGQLLADCVWKLAQGSAIPVPQDETKSSYHPAPSSADFLIPVAAWGARHVYNFVRALSDWDEAITLQIGDEQFVVRQEISYSHTLPASELGPKGEQDAAYYRVGEHIWVRCLDGWIVVSGN